MTWYEWKAEQLNRILHAPEGEGITAETVRHGEQNISHGITFMAQGLTKKQLRRSNRKWKNGNRDAAISP